LNLAVLRKAILDVSGSALKCIAKIGGHIKKFKYFTVNIDKIDQLKNIVKNYFASEEFKTSNTIL